MRVLVDTHAWFWWMTDDPQLSERARVAMADEDNEVFVSAVTAWELATKVRFHKWPEAAELAADIEREIAEEDFSILPVSIEHARVAGFLSSRHRDPFDRMLAAQSQVEGLSLISADPIFRLMSVALVW